MGVVNFTKIVFNNPINVSLQTGDAVYVSDIGSGGVISAPVFVAFVITVGSNYIVLDLPPTPIVITSGQYISFAKNVTANESSLKGYYADVTFENDSNKKTELFAVSSEVTLSSK